MYSFRAADGASAALGGGDTLVGGGGLDTLRGTAGSDTFTFAAGSRGVADVAALGGLNVLDLVASPGETIGSITGNFFQILQPTRQAVSTTTTVASSSPTSALNQPVTFSALVTASDGSMPAGTLTFEDGGTPLATVDLVNGRASITARTLGVGGHTITAVFNPSDGSTGSTSPTLSQTVNAYGAADHLAFLREPPTSVSLGQTLTGPVEVEVLDAFGNVVAGDNTSTVTLAPDHGSFDPASAPTATVQGGFAAFAGLALDHAGAYTLSGADGALGSAVSTGFMVNPGQPLLSVTTASVDYNGRPVAAKAQVSGVIAGVDNVPADSLEGVVPALTYYAGDLSAQQLATATPLPLGAPTDAGTYTVQAT
ncbi:MAG: Ig-like domain-containing protein, partial [Planctomycetia bacterium]|nr:Ig-like domain-containing protein [Planctomycetia bacterium]